MSDYVIGTATYYGTNPVTELLEADKAGRVIVLPLEAAGAQLMRLCDVPQDGTWEIARQPAGDPIDFAPWNKDRALWSAKSSNSLVLVRPAPTPPVQATLDANVLGVLLDFGVLLDGIEEADDINEWRKAVKAARAALDTARKAQQS